MGRSLNDSSMMLAMMAAQAITAGNNWGLPSFYSAGEIPRESNPILDDLNKRADATRAAVEAEIIEKARLKRERKSNKKSTK
jgi:DNA-directed RNA polymerase delta subunit